MSVWCWPWCRDRAADLANGMNSISSRPRVVGGPSCWRPRVGGGAVLGALIFGVLRNALPQIPAPRSTTD